MNVDAIVDEIRQEAARRRSSGEIPADLENSLEESFRKFIPATAEEAGAGELAEAVQRSEMLSHISHALPATSGRPFIGFGVSFVKRIIRKLTGWYVGGVADQSRNFASSAVRALWLITQKLEEFERREDQQRESLVALTKSIEGLNERLSSVKLEGRLARTERMLRFLENKVGDVESPSQPIERSEGGDGSRASREATSGTRVETTFDYFLFEESHRRGDELVGERTRRYVPYFRGQQDVLDFGCGKGEILQALVAEGIRAYGVEIHPEMVAACKEQGLEVVQGDGLEHLRSLESGSLGGIFLGQVVEHLEPRQLIDLVQLASNAIRDGGVFIAETVNPQTLGTFANAFYMDLSHVKPVHPITFKFLLESVGFIDVVVERLFPFPQESQLKEVPKEAAGARVLNENVRKLNELLWGPQDYAIVAKRP